jgi:hypothetical protein
MNDIYKEILIIDDKYYNNIITTKNGMGNTRKVTTTPKYRGLSGELVSYVGREEYNCFYKHYTILMYSNRNIEMSTYSKCISHYMTKLHNKCMRKLQLVDILNN